MIVGGGELDACGRFGVGDGDPSSVVRWSRRDVVLREADGSVAFAAEGIEAPIAWSDLAVATVARRYFLRGPGGPIERSVRVLVQRVVSEIGRWAQLSGHVRSPDERVCLTAELTALVLTQRGTFATPVWLNVGTTEKPITAACFILGVADSVPELLDWTAREGLIFQQGAGAGVNLSGVRSSSEPVSRGGFASGPISFMRAADSWAATIRAGGRARRGAKMVVLDADHPDVLDFIRSKMEEERRARALVAAGWDEADVQRSLAFQNSNHAVRVTDAFMHAATTGADWRLRGVTTGEPVRTLPAPEVLRECARAAWSCGDPGLQFADTINSWHTCPRSGAISASNPCGEFLHIDDSACNLATLNLLRFVDQPGGFDVDGFVHAVNMMVLAQDAMVDGSGYPSDATGSTAHRFRQLGLGYTNLAAALLYVTLPYDSRRGRAWAAAVTALMTGAAYRMSAQLARELGPFAGFEQNRDPMLAVIDRHRAALEEVPSCAPRGVMTAALDQWREARRLGESSGFRNAQVTLIPPTGTVSLMLDCETTGIEPYYTFDSIRRFVEGGQAVLHSRVLPAARRRLGHDDPDLLRTAIGPDALGPAAHVAMVAAVQPFVSGGIAKTVNLPREASVEEVEAVMVDAWRRGLKGVTVYRQGSKALQPVRAPSDEDIHEVPTSGE
jgi:ribonucleoside-diphosphate reductase alpha chain